METDAYMPSTACYIRPATFMCGNDVVMTSSSEQIAPQSISGKFTSVNLLVGFGTKCICFLTDIMFQKLDCDDLVMDNFVLM